MAQVPSYRETFVYGNVLIEFDGEGNRQMIHYGGDSGREERYRNGTLYFYHNTVVSTRTVVVFRVRYFSKSRREASRGPAATDRPAVVRRCPATGRRR